MTISELNNTLNLILAKDTESKCLGLMVLDTNMAELDFGYLMICFNYTWQNHDLWFSHAGDCIRRLGIQYGSVKPFTYDRIQVELETNIEKRTPELQVFLVDLFFNLYSSVLEKRFAHLGTNNVKVTISHD